MHRKTSDKKINVCSLDGLLTIVCSLPAARLAGGIAGVSCGLLFDLKRSVVSGGIGDFFLASGRSLRVCCIFCEAVGLEFRRGDCLCRSAVFAICCARAASCVALGSARVADPGLGLCAVELLGSRKRTRV